MVRVDLGCGNRKPEGFIGVDRYALTGVDIVADLNQSLPFYDNSVDLVLSSHGLEHLSSLQETMKEIYRICRHGAQVCIIAPYGLESLVSPFHKQIFNEHTPRFWTNIQTSAIDPADYFYPYIVGWGLAESDNSPAEVDFRCLRMEFFYFPEYRHLSQEEQRRARQKYLNVCDNVMYHLVVVKEPISEGDMEEITKRIEYYEPPGITIRKFQERSESLELALKRVQSMLELREAEVVRVRGILAEREKELEDAKAEMELHRTRLNEVVAQNTDLEAEVVRVRGTLAEREKELEDAKAEMELHWTRLTEVVTQNTGLEAEVVRVRGTLAEREKELEYAKAEMELYRTRLTEVLAQSKILEAEVVQVKEILNKRERDLENIQSTLESREVEIRQIRTVLTTRDAELEEARRTLQARESDLDLFKKKGNTISSELDLFRHRKVTRLVNRFLNKSDLKNNLLPTFLQLKDDSFMFTKNLKGFRLLPSKNLQRIPFVYYPLELNRSNLKGILVAPIMDFPSVNGVLGIEIVSPDGHIVAHSVVPASQINEVFPTRFDFSPIQNSDRGRFWLRVFVHHVDFPVRIFEWRKYDFLGLGSPQTRAFCGFLFENVA